VSVSRRRIEAGNTYRLKKGHGRQPEKRCVSPNDDQMVAHGSSKGARPSMTGKERRR